MSSMTEVKRDPKLDEKIAKVQLRKVKISDTRHAATWLSEWPEKSGKLNVQVRDRTGEDGEGFSKNGYAIPLKVFSQVLDNLIETKKELIAAGLLKEDGSIA
jgi:hypothetical protein